ncbi:helix-turn-helix domain-containing protein [Streptomyces sp. NPDC001634]|uniref:helix-turn-helix domain-containing protein n=1 Tax=Streptomyces sp. NPDC001634 TaxID=3154390 RepID=UPI0033345EFF
MTSASVAPTGDYLTTGEAAKRIGGTPQHVRELIKSGRLEAIDIAKGNGRPRFRIAEAALAEFLRAARVTPEGDTRRGGAIRIPEAAVLAYLDFDASEVA